MIAALDILILHKLNNCLSCKVSPLLCFYSVIGFFRHHSPFRNITLPALKVTFSHPAISYLYCTC